MKIPLKKLLPIYILCALTACNGGGANNNEVIQSSDLVDNPEEITPYSHREIGYGFDPSTGMVYDPGLRLADGFYDEGDLAYSDTPTSLIKGSDSKYSDYASYSGSAEDINNAQKSSISGGIGGGFGLFSASMKAAYSSQFSQGNTTGIVNKTAGLVQEKKYFLVNEAGQKDTSLTLTKKRLALLNGLPQVKAQIKKINDATTPYFKNLAITEFYEMFGPYVITSVTKGWMAVHNVTLTKKQSTSSNETSAEAGAGFSSPWANASLDVGVATASNFNKADWDYKATTVAIPSNNDVLASVMSIYDKIDADIQQTEETLKLDEIKKPIDSTQLHFPGFPKEDFILSDATRNLYNDKKQRQTSMKADLNSLALNTSSISQYMERRDSEYDEDKKQSYIEQINILCETQRELLNKFTNEYAMFSLNSTEQVTINQARIITNNARLAAKEVEESLDEQNTSITEHKAAASHYTTFMEWFNDEKTSELYSGCGDNNQITVYFTQIPCTSSGISSLLSNESTVTYLQKEWNDYLKDKGISAPNGLTINSQQLKAKRLSLQKKAFKDSPLSEDSDPAVINFAVAKWVDFFPELKPMAINDSFKGPLVKTYQDIQDFLDMRSYLALVSRLDKDGGALNQLFVDDTPVYNTLLKISSSVTSAIYEEGNAGSLVMYGNKEYDLNDSNGVKDFRRLVTNTINKSKMVNSEWYKIASKLKLADLLKPQGALMGTSTGTDREYTAPVWSLQVASPLAQYKTATTSFSGPIFNGSSIVTTKDKNFGQQLAVGVTTNNQIMNTALPLIFNNTTYDAATNSIVGVSYLFSNGFIWNPAIDGGKNYAGSNTFTYKLVLNNRDPSNKYSIYSNVGLDKNNKLCPTFTGVSGIIDINSPPCGSRYNSAYPDNYKSFYLFASPINSSIAQSMYTEMGDSQANSKNPLFKLFYSSDGNTTSNVLEQIIFAQ